MMDEKASDPGSAGVGMAEPQSVAPAPAAAPGPGGPDVSARALLRANLYAVVVVPLVLLLVGGLALLSSYRGSLREAEARASGAAAILAEQVDLSLVGVDALLQGLGERLADGAQTARSLATALARRGGDMAMVRGLTVIGANGTVIAGSRPLGRSGSAGSFADAPFFRAHLDQDDGGLYLGPPIREDGGGWIVPASRAVRAPDGGLRAVMVAAIDPTYFDTLFRAIDGDGRLWGALTKVDGTLLAPFPFNARALEAPIAGYPWFVSRLHDSRAGAAWLPSPDGVERLVVHRTFGHGSLILAAGLATEDALAPFLAEARLWALGLALAFTLTVVGARYHLRQARRIAGQAGQLGRYAEDLTRVNALLELEIEERRRAAAELNYRNLLLDAQLQMSPDGILVVDEDGRIRSWNQRFSEIWRLPEAPLDDDDRDLVMGVAAERLLEPQALPRPIGQLFGNLAQEDTGGDVLFKDGRIVERFSRALVDHQGRLSGRVWFFRDVTLARRAAETARKLAAIVNSSNDAIIGKTIGGLIESWNAAAELMFGHTAEGIIGQPLQCLFPSERADEIAERLVAASRGERIAHLETLGRHADGSRIYLSVTISPIHDDRGRVTGLSTIARDISRRKIVEAALREREQRNRVVLESLSEGVLLHDADGRVVAANSAAHRILGRFLDGAGLTGDTLVPLGALAMGADGQPIPPGHQPADIARATGVPVLDVTIGLRRPEDPPAQTAWLLVNAQPILGETGEGGVDGVVVSLLDITTRKKAEEELRESERHFRRTFDESPIGAAMVSLNNRILKVNAELCRITGYEATDLVGQGIGDIALRQDRDLDAELARQLIRGEIAYYQVDKRCRRRDGAPIWLHFSVRMIRDAGGRPGYFLPMIEDITERKRAEERLARGEAEARAAKTSADLANRAKSEFLATMSHELRSPLNAILGFAEILMLEMFGPLGSPRYVGYAKDIHDSGALLLSVIGDILDLSKIEAGKLELHEDLVDLTSVVTTAERLVHTRAQDHGLTLASDLPPGLPLLWADGRLMVQMLVNLLSNAIKFTPRGGAVTVRARLMAGDGDGDGGGLALAVIDTGIGIADEDLPKALAPFEQVDNHLTRNQAGTGLGLPLVKSLIDLHGGAFAIESEPGVGTTVSLTFPPERLRPEGLSTPPAR